MRRVPESARHALAAEYVLGTLRGRARRRFEEHVRTDRALAEVVRAWEAWLTPLAERLAPVEPPERVWQAIRRRIAPRGSSPEPATSFWSSLAFWRGLGIALTMVLVALLAFFPRPQPQLQGPSMVAVLNAPENDPRMVVERHDGRLMVRVVKPWKEMPGQDLELWAIPKDGKPRSLGVVRYDRDTELRLANLDQQLAGSVAFAVSREPAGGSPSPDGPTGPVLCSGPIARALRA